MDKQIMTCINTGMTRDLGISQLSEKQANYAFENHNIRITAIDDNTLYTVTNEKGTSHEATLEGTFLGSCVLNEYIVIFASLQQHNINYIYRINYNYINDTFNVNILYQGNLNFDLEHPIEAIGYYESEEVQKVYWVDGINPSRFINIANDKNGYAPNYPENKIYQFDFQGHIENIPEISIYKNYNKGGSFQAGTIQYFATYYNKYGTETCIVWQSDLQYISALDRGAKPDEVISCAFDFNISNLDTSYDYIRIYAAYRAGLNGTAEGRIVTELEITENNVAFTDFGTSYQNYNAEDIHYLGGQNIVASTLDYKQDTLFLGNIQLGNNDEYFSKYRDMFRQNCVNKTYEGIEICECPCIEWKYKKITDNNDNISTYEQQINNSQSSIAGFKYRELYRFGIQYMDHTGEWTSPIWIGDKYCNLPPVSTQEIPEETTHYGITFYNHQNQKVKGLFYKIYNGTDGYLQGYYLKVNLTGGGEHFYSNGNSVWRDLIEKEYTKEESYAFAQSLVYTSYDIYDQKHLRAEDKVIKEASLDEGAFIAQAVFKHPTFMSMVGYTAYRLLVAETSIESRRIITQGVINPTMFNYKDRENNKPFSINSWIFRPRQANITNRHYDMLHTQESEYAEIQGVMSRKLPGYQEKEVDSKYKDGYLLIFAPNYLAGCRLWYKLIYYKTDTCSPFRQSDYKNVLNEESQNNLSSNLFSGKEAAVVISKTNQCLKEDATIEDMIPYHFTEHEMVSQGLIKATSWKKIQAEVISKITTDVSNAGYDVVISESMLPSAEQYKQAANATDSADPSQVWSFVGLGVALAASVVATVFSFGAASPAVAAVTATAITAITVAEVGTALGLAAAAAASVIAAIGSTAAIATIADQAKYNEDLKDIDKTLSYKGIYSILGNHKLASRRQGATIANTLLSKMFNNWKDDDPFTLKATNNSLGSDSNFYSMGGRLSLLSDKENDKNLKQDAYYIDESIVTLNSPDVDNIIQSVNNSSAYKLDLIGTIPIEQIATEYTMYAEQGLASTSQPIPGLNKNTIFGEGGYEGLYNGFLYQDSSFPKEFDPTEEGAYIQATANVSGYKTYMWNRNTSWSLWLPSITVKDVYGNVLTSPPAKPIKKIFANIKYSKNTIYQNSIYSIETDPLKAISSNQSSLNLFQYNGDDKYYYGNVDAIVFPSEDYTLITDKDNNEFIKGDNGKVLTSLKDPVPLRYKSTPHIVIPFKWGQDASHILPITNTEDIMTPVDMYGEDAGKSSILGVPNKGLSGQVVQEPVISDYYLLNYSYYYSIPVNSWNNSSSSQLYSAKVNMLETIIDWYSYAKSIYNEDESGVPWDEIDRTLVNRVFQQGNILYSGSKGVLCKADNKFESINIEAGTIYGEVRIIDQETLIVDNIVDAATIISGQAIRRTDPSVEAGQTIFYVWPDGTIHDTPYVEVKTWKQDKLAWQEPSSYLFLGELVRKDFDYNSWYNGNTDYALQQLTWNVCSAITPISDNIENTWGDTYYQRWECLKTYPYTEQEVNSNVEVLSFMLESHTNLDGRSDINRGVNNLLNLRPSNTNLFNPVYNQQDNFFSYKILDEKFDKNIFENQVVWSLSKSNLDNIDKWTDIHAVNNLQLDGKLGSINKIINMNDTLLAFQDNGISTIDYNLKSALTTYEGVPLQMGNTGKVTGYTKVTSDIGCHNKWAICLTDSGLFFIDSYRKALYMMSSNTAPANVSQESYFSTWFKDNINTNIWDPLYNKTAYRLNYDESTQDLYIINEDTCLLYNIKLKTFTSFMDYTNTPLIINNKGKSLAFQQTVDEESLLKDPKINMWSLFEGHYNNIYGQNREYSIEYRLNPSPYTDNMFTNYQYVADWVTPSYKSNDPCQFTGAFNSRFDHFTTVEAWNEYQHGILNADTSRIGAYPAKTKFRIWRGDIPRNGDTLNKRILKGDRMRNPWIHLKFTKAIDDKYSMTSKMTFHNLNVIYYK